MLKGTTATSPLARKHDVGVFVLYEINYEIYSTDRHRTSNHQ